MATVKVERELTAEELTSKIMNYIDLKTVDVPVLAVTDIVTALSGQGIRVTRKEATDSLINLAQSDKMWPILFVGHDGTVTLGINVHWKGGK